MPGCTIMPGCAAITLGGAAVSNALGARLSLRTILIASNANVGGPGTAIAMASAMGWLDLIPAAAAVGTVGYSVATVFGVAMHTILSPT